MAIAESPWRAGLLAPAAAANHAQRREISSADALAHADGIGASERRRVVACAWDGGERVGRVVGPLSMPAQAPFSAGRVAWTAADTRLAGAVIPAQQHATHLTILDL